MEEDIVNCFLGGESMTKISKRLRKSFGYVKFIIVNKVGYEEVSKIIQERRRPKKAGPEPVETDPIGWRAFLESHRHRFRRL